MLTQKLLKRAAVLLAMTGTAAAAVALKRTAKQANFNANPVKNAYKDSGTHFHALQLSTVCIVATTACRW